VAGRKKAKFDQDYVIYDLNYVRSVCQTTSKDEVWQQDDLVITSIDFAKQDDMLEALENTEWDIAVFDEAHHLTARKRTTGRSAKRTDTTLERPFHRTLIRCCSHGDPTLENMISSISLAIDLLEPYRFEDETRYFPGQTERCNDPASQEQS